MYLLASLLVLPILFELLAAAPEDRKAYSFILKPENRQNQAVIDSIIADANKIAYTPLDENVYAAKSNHFGTFVITVGTAEKNGQPFWDSHKDKFLGWADISKQDGSGIASRAVSHRSTDNIEHLPRADSPATKAIGRDVNSADELVSVSQPPGTRWEDLQQNFYYDTSLGEGTVIYLIDSGVNIKHDEFSEIDFDPTWIWTGPAPATGDKSDGDAKLAHGTGVLGKIAGKYAGVARKAKIVVVRITTKYGAWSNANGVDGLLKTYDDILARYQTAKVVINMSWRFEIDKGNDAYNNANIDISTELMKSFVALKNVVLVTSAGNDDPPVPITQAPAVSGATVPELIVVSGMGKTGALAYQKAPYVKIGAVSIRVISPRGDWYEKMSGSSFGAGIVSGVVAYLMGLGDTPETVRQSLYAKAWSRQAGDVPVVWNGVDWRNVPGPPQVSPGLLTVLDSGPSSGGQPGQRRGSDSRK